MICHSWTCNDPAHLEFKYKPEDKKEDVLPLKSLGLGRQFTVEIGMGGHAYNIMLDGKVFLNLNPGTAINESNVYTFVEKLNKAFYVYDHTQNLPDKPEHSKLPWVYCKGKHDEDICECGSIHSADHDEDYTIAEVSGPRNVDPNDLESVEMAATREKQIANASFILLACNSYYDLVAEIEKLKAKLPPTGYHDVDEFYKD
jgi:hypothetical protein